MLTRLLDEGSGLLSPDLLNLLKAKFYLRLAKLEEIGSCPVTGLSTSRGVSLQT